MLTLRPLPLLYFFFISFTLCKSLKVTICTLAGTPRFSKRTREFFFPWNSSIYPSQLNHPILLWNLTSQGFLIPLCGRDDCILLPLTPLWIFQQDVLALAGRYTVIFDPALRTPYPIQFAEGEKCLSLPMVPVALWFQLPMDGCGVNMLGGGGKDGGRKRERAFI